MNDRDDDKKTGLGLESSMLMNLSPHAQAGIAGTFIGIPTLAIVDAMLGLGEWTILPECLGVAGIALAGGYILKKNNINLKDQFQDLNWGALLGVPEQQKDEQEEETSPPAKTVPAAVEETKRSPQTDLEAARRAIVPPCRHSMPLSPAMLQSTPSAQPAQLAPLPVQNVPSVPTNRTVDLGDTLQLDIDDIVGKAIFVCGIRRSGKTTLGAKLAEEMGRFLIPMLIPDIKRDYLSLADHLPRALVITQRNIPYEPKDEKKGQVSAARRMGKAIFEEGYQLILDMASYDSVDDACGVLCEMIAGLFEWARQHPESKRPCEGFLDEAQSFLPQEGGSIIGDPAIYKLMLSTYKQLLAVGGSLGLNPVILTQRIAQVNKVIIGQPELLFLLKQTMDVDLERYKGFTPIDPKVIRGFRKGQGIFVDYEGESHIVQFHNRASDGSMSASPRASAVLKPLTKPVTRENFPYASELAVQSEPFETRVLEESEYEFEDDEWDIYRKPFASARRDTDEIPVAKPVKTDRVPAAPAKYQKELAAWKAGNQSVRSFAKAMEMKETAAYRLLQDMEKRGLIQMKKRAR